jgi:hypothetical protein
MAYYRYPVKGTLMAEKAESPAGGTLYVPSNRASRMPRSFRIARTALRFPEKSRNNKTPLSSQSHVDPVRGPDDTNSKNPEGFFSSSWF